MSGVRRVVQQWMMGLFNIDRDFKLMLFQLKKSKLFYDMRQIYIQCELEGYGA
jgi:hypothetical protein